MTQASDSHEDLSSEENMLMQEIINLKTDANQLAKFMEIVYRIFLSLQRKKNVHEFVRTNIIGSWRRATTQLMRDHVSFRDYNHNRSVRNKRERERSIIAFKSFLCLFERIYPINVQHETLSIASGVI